MKLFIVVAVLGYACAAKLSNSYIPPSHNAGTAGGAGFLQAPNNQYIPPGQQNYNQAGHSGAGFSGAGHQGGGYSQQNSGPQIPIIRYENVNNGDGSYHFEYETGNGIMQHEQGHLNNPGTDHSEQVVEGEYSYTGDDGKLYKVNYKADANGFQAYGDHLPTAPPIPEAIQKSIALNAASAGQGYSHGGQNDGQYNQGAYVEPQKSFGSSGRQQSFNSNTGYNY